MVYFKRAFIEIKAGWDNSRIRCRRALPSGTRGTWGTGSEGSEPPEGTECSPSVTFPGSSRRDVSINCSVAIAGEWLCSSVAVAAGYYQWSRRNSEGVQSCQEGSNPRHLQPRQRNTLLPEHRFKTVLHVCHMGQ